MRTTERLRGMAELLYVSALTGATAGWLAAQPVLAVTR